MNYKILFSTLAGVVAIYVGYQFASLPIPDGLAEPWKMRGYVMVFTVIWNLNQFYSPYGMKILKGIPLNIETSRVITDTEFGKVPVRIYAPPSWNRDDEALPALVFLHGGGWVGGSIDSYHYALNDIATQLDRVVIVSVGYRLAPQHPFPASIDDCTTATTWLLSHTKDYNINPDRIGIAGDSAGGNLAAAVAQRLTFDSQYSHLPKLRLQALIYPALQAVDFETPSYQQNGHYKSVVLTEELMVKMWGLYLNGDKVINFVAAASVNNHTSPSAKKQFADIVSHNHLPATLRSGEYVPPTSTNFGNESLYNSIKDTLLNPDFATLMRTNLRGLPEAYVLTCHFDVLRDDGMIYATRLEKARVKVVLKYFEDGVHGGMTEQHDGLFGLKTGRKIRRDFVTYLKETLLALRTR